MGFILELSLLLGLLLVLYIRLLRHVFFWVCMFLFCFLGGALSYLLLPDVWAAALVVILTSAALGSLFLPPVEVPRFVDTFYALCFGAHYRHLTVVSAASFVAGCGAARWYAQVVKIFS